MKMKAREVENPLAAGLDALAAYLDEVRQVDMGAGDMDAPALVRLAGLEVCMSSVAMQLRALATAHRLALGEQVLQVLQHAVPEYSRYFNPERVAESA